MTEITIDLDRLGFGGEDGVTFREAVITEVARRALYDAGGTMTEVRDRARRITDDEIRARIAPMIGEALTKALQPTNTWGEPKGEPTTLREVIVDRATRYLTEPDPERSLHRGEPRKTRVEGFIAKEVKAAVDEQMRVTMVQAQAEITEAVKDRAAEVLAERLVKATR